MAFSQNDLVQVTREIETTEGEVIGGARVRTYGLAPTYKADGNTTKSGINTGSGGTRGIRAGLRFADVDLPSELVFELNHPEFEDVLRDEFPASPIKTSVTATYAPAGTHEDGSTGATVTGSAGDFDDFVGEEGAIVEASGPTEALNQNAHVLKAVSSDGSKIDFYGQVATEAAIASVLSIGQPCRNRGIENARSVNFEFNYTDQPGGSFVMARGQKGNGLKIDIDAKGNVRVGFNYIGMDYDIATEATQGNGTVTANPGVDNENINSAEDLTSFVIGNPGDSAATEIAGDNLTTFSLSGAGNGSGIDEVAGSRSRPGTTVGDLDFTGSLKVLHEHTKMKILMTLAHAGNKTPIAWKLVDPDGNFYWMRLAKALFKPSGPMPGAKNSRTDGTFAFDTQLGDGDVRTFIVQAFNIANALT